MGLCVSKREYIIIKEDNEKLKKEREELIKEREELKKENKRLNSQIINVGEPIPPINFYDIIIYIQSINDITYGWKVEFNSRIVSKYDEFTKCNVLKIGVIGNANKGKSFILSKISNYNLPCGTSIKTQGLSIKYPELENFPNKKIALLDSAGLETPVLLEEERPNKIKEKGQELNNKNQQKNDLFKDKSRDKIITELFLQNYIINNSDILIVVVGILSYSEQKLLNRIKTELRRKNCNKKIYVIHNLMTYKTKKQVEDYINQTCLRSATFHLKKQIIVNNKQNKEEEGACFYETNTAKNLKNTNPEIKHLIFANEGSEAGNYYNKFTLEYLEKTYIDISSFEPFDVIETVKETFKKASKEILENKKDNILFDNSNKNLIKLVSPQKIILKKCLIDELGFQNLRANGYEPSYNCYKKGKTIIIRLEAPGNCILTNLQIHPQGEYTFIRISGEKYREQEPDKNELCLFNSRENGEFSLDIPFKHEDFWFKDKKPEIHQENGIFIIKYELER